MAYKDEYEVARLMSDPGFSAQVRNQFAGDNLRFEFHLAPPMLAKKNSTTGEPMKMSFGPWMMSAFRILAKFKGLRGGALDIFGKTEERKMERQLIADYETLIGEVVGKLTADNRALAIGLANIPQKIRGYGHVKLRNVKVAKAEEAALLEQFRAGPAPALKAAE